MKKLVLFFAAVVAVSFASCGTKGETTENVDTPATEEVVTEEVTTVVDSMAVDTTATVEEVKEEVK